MKLTVPLVFAFSQAATATTMAFAPGRNAVVRKCAPTMGIPLLGRFRKKRTVDIPEPISIGSPLPEADVEVVENGKGVPMAISEVLGDGTAILVGMPGAYTPTCSGKHLPGYIKAAPKLESLGVDKIAVVTTNDKYVNENWAKDLGIIDESGEEGQENVVTMLADGDGDLVRQLGLVEDMGFGVGMRSKRFALVVKEGKASYLAVDEGMDTCESSSAESLVKVLTPEDELEEIEFDPKVLAGAGALLLAFLFLSSHGDGGSTATVAPAVKSVVPAVKSATSGGGSFNLLKEFL